MIHYPSYKWHQQPVLKIGAIIVVITGILWLYLFDPQIANTTPACIFKKITGLDCPGCGSARAIHQLLHGHLLKAIDYNLLLVLLIPFLLGKTLGWLIKTEPVWLTNIYKAKWVFWLVLTFWILRNLNFFPLTFLNSSF